MKHASVRVHARTLTYTHTHAHSHTHTVPWKDTKEVAMEVASGEGLGVG